MRTIFLTGSRFGVPMACECVIGFNFRRGEYVLSTLGGEFMGCGGTLEEAGWSVFQNLRDE